MNDLRDVYDSNSNKRILGVTLARGNSKGIKNKNLALLNGMPLISYTISEALKSQYLTEYIISTDSPEIAQISKSLGAQVPFLRPSYLSSDTAKSSDALLHSLMFMESELQTQFDYVVEIMTTNPFKTSQDIDSCIEMLSKYNCDSVIAVHRIYDNHPSRVKKINNGKIENFCVDEEYESRRQDLSPPAYVRSGAIYALNRNWFIQNKRRYGSERSFAYILDDHKSINIDSELDLAVATAMMKTDRNYFK